jgi:3-hydroxyisobutyryl-CoA hydrolase
MDGITMGGGVGLSVHAPIRIATERTLFAMPETTIGFFPDVGGSFFLPRLDGEIGTYLALTSERLKGVQAYWSGIATHYIDSSYLGNLTARLSELVFKDYADLEERLKIINATIDEFSTGLPYDEPPLLVGQFRKTIDRCFGHNTVEEIIASLEEEQRSGKMKDWAAATLKTLSERSPTSLKVTLKQLRIGRRWCIAETFQREHHIASTFMEHPDFVSGVTAKLITKPPQQAKWNPPTLNEVSTKDVDKFFDVQGQERLNLLSDDDYDSYPHDWLKLPSERQIMGFVKNAGTPSLEGVVDEFFKRTNGKEGVREKVEEVLRRRFRVGKDGALN